MALPIDAIYPAAILDSSEARVANAHPLYLMQTLPYKQWLHPVHQTLLPKWSRVNIDIQVNFCSVGLCSQLYIHALPNISTAYNR